ncbi:MAG: cytochrome c oxidase assembly protein [Dehalococcoidia bacterium]
MRARRLAVAGMTATILAMAPRVASAHVPLEGGATDAVGLVEVGAVLLLLGASAACYAKGVGRLWRHAGRGRGVGRAQVACFWAGLAVLGVALLGPMVWPVTEDFSGHMAQHLLLLVVAAPLLAWSDPLLVAAWAVRDTSARPLLVGWSAVARWRVTRLLVAGPVVLAVYAGVVWAWHLPVLYDAAVRHDGWHALEHVTMALAALLFWGRVRWLAARRPAQQVVAAALLFAAMFPDLVLGAFLAFASTPLYEAHRTVSVTGLAPLVDQQLGGLLMLMVGGMAYLGVALALMLRLLNQPASEARLHPSTGGRR